MRTYILSGIIGIIAILIFMNASQDMSSYSNFEEATRSGDRVKVTGTLAKEQPMKYDPENEPNIFHFTMKDVKGEERKVLLKKPKPQDFELSESIVLTGKMDGEVFVADEILMKCPSKYKEEEIALKEQI